MAGRFSVDAVFRGVDHFSRTFVRMSANTSRFSRSLHRGLAGIEGVTGRVVGGFGRIIRYASLAGTAMAGLAARDIVKTGMDFEAQMSAVGAVMLKTREEIGALTAEAKRLGATTKFTATEAAAGMEIMAKAGYKERDILTGISGVLNAAAASGQDLAETADHVSNVLKGMGMATSEAGKVADVLALASSRTNSTIGSLGESMKNVSAIARQLNIPLEQVVAAVASLQDVGLDASVAGTATATMLTKLASPSDALRAKLKGMGVAFEDAKGNMLPFPAVLANLAKMADKAGGNAKQLAAFAELMGLRGQKAGLQLQDLARKGKLEALVAELEKAAGVAEEMAKLRLDNLAGDVTLFRSALSAVEIKLFGVKDGALRGIVQRAREWLTVNEDIIAQDFGYWVDQLRPLKVLFTNAFMETLKGIGKAFDSWTKPFRSNEEIASSPGWRWFAQTLGKTLAILLVFVPTMLLLNVAVRVARVGLLLFEGAMKLVTLATHAGTVATIFSKVAHWARNVAIAIGAIGMKQLTLATIADTVKTAANTVVQWGKAAAQAAVNLAVRTGQGIVALYALLTSGATLKDIAATIALWAKAAAQGAVNLATGAYNKIAGTCIKLIAGTGEAAAGAATGMSAFALTLGAVAAAATAVYLAVKQFLALLDEAEGKGGLIGVMSLLMPLSAPVSAAMLKQHQDRLARERAAARGPYQRVAPVAAGATAKAAETAEAMGEGTGTRWVETAGGLMPDMASELQKTLDMLGTQTSDQTSMMSDLQKSMSSLGNLGDLGALTGEQADSQASIAESMQRAADAQEQLTKLLTPGERVSRSVAEIIKKEKVEAEVTIKDETGKAHVTKSPKGKGFGIRVQPSGAF